MKMDDKTFCFLRCASKAECNAERGGKQEANCVSNLEHVSGRPPGDKICVPPNA